MCQQPVIEVDGNGIVAVFEIYLQPPIACQYAEDEDVLEKHVRVQQTESLSSGQVHKSLHMAPPTPCRCHASSTRTASSCPRGPGPKEARPTQQLPHHARTDSCSLAKRVPR
jgi:hypothetical protein